MNSVNQGSTCPTIGEASARYTRGLTQEGPGVSINLVGGCNSSIGLDILNNLLFRAERQRTGAKICYTVEHLARLNTHSIRSNLSRGRRPHKILVCSIPLERATANMVLRTKEITLPYM